MVLSDEIEHDSARLRVGYPALWKRDDSFWNLGFLRLGNFLPIMLAMGCFCRVELGSSIRERWLQLSLRRSPRFGVNLGMICRGMNRN
jgi:hypothetical protein